MNSLTEKATPWRRNVARLLILTLVLMVTPVWAMGQGATLEGMLLDEAGKPATELEVVLFDAEGEQVAEASADQDGIYGFADLNPGTYALAVRDASGEASPVASQPVTLARGELARRDLQQVSADSAAGINAQINPSLGTRWAGLSNTNKVWVVVGILAGVALIYSVVDDDDDDETAASPAAP
ncbi:hypothetical protein ABI59_06130 [Acidobacteria bacterium Mor1]|nr:hypothetical protein ABI59_06130 [Acidobacteria bacterium Mor1]